MRLGLLSIGKQESVSFKEILCIDLSINHLSIKCVRIGGGKYSVSFISTLQ